MSDATQPILKAEHLGITFGGRKAVGPTSWADDHRRGELIGLGPAPTAPARPRCSTC